VELKGWKLELVVVSLCETEVVLSLFGAAKSNQKLLVARKATTHYET
jgi:hypothetical protein